MSVSIHSRTIDIIIPQSTFVSPMRLERMTPSLKVRCSNQLSYEDRCGTDWIRTSDTQIFSLVLYQLSYGTKLNQYVKEHFVDRPGLEPGIRQCKCRVLANYTNSPKTKKPRDFSRGSFNVVLKLNNLQDTSRHGNISHFRPF